MADLVLATSERDDEHPHAPGPEASWQDAWYVDFVDEAAGVAGFVRLALLPAQGVAWWWTHLLVDGRLVVVRDHTVRLPRSGLGVRAEGLWADLVCETPMEHWSVGLEAFGTAVDGPDDVLARPEGEPWGERVAVGLDLEWEALGPWHDHPVGRPDHGHYQHAGVVHGDVLLGDRRVAIDGLGERVREWGPRDWWARDWHWAALHGGGGAWSASAAVLAGVEGSSGYVAAEGGAPHPLRHVAVATRDVAGRPEGATYAVGDDDVLPVDAGVALRGADSEVVGLAPVPLVGPDGRQAVLWRAWCRSHTDLGPATGWAEWLRVERGSGR